MKQPRFFALGLATLGLLLVTGCKPSAQAPAAPPPPTVTIAPVEQREIVEFDTFTGRLDAVESVEIRPRVSGYLTEIKFTSGQLVKKGDVLFVINPKPRQTAVARAQADLERAKVAAEIAEREAKRAVQLLANQTISPEEGDASEWKARDARAALTAAEAALHSAEIELDYCFVKSPVDGRVSRALVTIGNNVSGVDGFTTLLTTVVSVNPIYGYMDVDEASLLKLRRLLASDQLAKDAQGRIEVEMGLSDDTGFPNKGYVESFDNRLDPATGSIVVRSEFPNPDGHLVPGLFAKLRLPGSARKPALLISENAIGTDQSQKFVLTLTTSNTVAYRPVKLGPLIEGKRVVREGLKPGEQIVVNGLMRVQPGMPVTPQTESDAPKVARR